MGLTHFKMLSHFLLFTHKHLTSVPTIYEDKLECIIMGRLQYIYIVERIYQYLLYYINQFI